jgi:hypothetical protein
MTLAEFSKVFSVLAIQLRATDADKATCRSYYEALKDVEYEFLAQAAVDMGRAAEWFPKTSEWRAAALQIEHRRKLEQAQLLKALAEPLCSICNDTGWALDGQERAYRCNCQDLRRLELLGRRPMPKLIAASPDQASVDRADDFIRRLRTSFPRVVVKDQEQA